MKEFIRKNIIEKGGYVLEDVEQKIKKLYLLGDLAEEDMDELLLLAANEVDNSAQVDLFRKLVDLEHRVYALETADYVIWSSGYITKKGEIVKYDIDADGVLDLCMYDGGRTETALGIGAIDGWYLVDSQGTKLGTIVRNADKKSWTVTPIEVEA